ncbi:carbohydrate ABC transporter permease [Isoptericola variabilis]|uniref:ABC-type transporter, integral membrane subunit n=1 Tax=Isoptericola variabilis (strain 225) TaxID=743718 RepID=F6FSB3_ISOV2|nr:carbohydrate ABC transporter permease [Isoptericola variabilis]AEG43054.1 ABC-type transporter, integral membrane subunit [Isoptericola variabilis 225]TWH29977.1 sn-glycerol 3-phosphate transport system permease protein [Isoptericola variabilis J7]
MSVLTPRRPEPAAPDPTTPGTQAAPPTGAPPSGTRATPTPRRRRRRVLPVGGYLALVLATVVLGAPLVWMVLASVKTPADLYQVPLQWLPTEVTLDNYAQAARTIPLGRLLLNSIGLTVVGAGLKVVLGLCCAYALVFLDIPFKKVVFGLVIATLMIPPQITIIPNYTLVASLGWLNTYQGILVPGLASAFGTFLFRQHFLTLPRSVLEAAELDGAGHWRRLWRFVVPMSTPTLAAVALVSVVTEWNDYLWPFLVVDDPSRMTLPVGLTLLQNVDGMTSWGVLLAATVVVTLPILAVFLVLQRRLVAGLTAGAVTG